MSTSAFPALLGISGDPTRRLVAGGLLFAPATLSRAQVTSRATALGPDDATLVLYSADTPRFAGAALRLLTEGQRTNEVADPLAFGAGSGWSALNGGTGSAPVITANYAPIAAPDGSFTATRLQLNRGGGTLATDLSGLSRATTTTAARFVWVRTVAGTANVQIGTNATTAGLQSSVDTTWRRLGVSDGTGTFRIMLVGGGTNSASADLLVWGASSEAGAAFPSSLILPPAGSPQSSTRGTDVVSAPLAALGIGGNGACTVLWSGLLAATAIGVEQVIVQVDDGTNANSFRLRNLPTSGAIQATRTLGGATAGAAPGSVVAGTSFRLGMSLAGDGSMRACLNGGAVSGVSGGPTSGLAMLRLGGNAANGAPIFGETTRLQVLPYASSDAALAAAVAALPV